MQNTNLKHLYTFDGRFTFDLHDLAAIILRERQLSDNRFKHTRLREVCVGGTTATCLPAHGQTIWTSIPAPNKVAYFLKEQPTVDGIANHPLELSEFLDPELRLPPGRAPLSEKEKELLFWRIRHHDSGYILCDALQHVLDSLPVDRTKLRIRTSQGHAVTELSPTAFHVVEVAVLPKQCTYICTFRPHASLPEMLILEQHLHGEDFAPMPWVYLLFGDTDVASTDATKDGRVMLDLVSPLLGMRGLGGELFSMERLIDYHEKVLPTGGEEVINHNDLRSIEHNGFILSGRIKNDSKPEANAIVQDLAERVLRRLSRIAKGEETYCAYCGKHDANVRCSKCKKAMYCGRVCQASAWKYHKTWCDADARATDSS